MKLIVSFLSASVQVNAYCAVKVENKEDCQKVCDLVTDCGAWTFDSTGYTSDTFSKCFLKTRHGWTSNPVRGCYSGFKNGTAYEDTDFSGADLNSDL